MKQIIYTDGIYDLFHRGHLESFIQIKAMFPDCHLIVGIINDADATAYKRKPIYNEDDRYCIIEHITTVDQVVRSSPLIITKEFLDEHKIDMVVHGFSNVSDSTNQDDFFKIPKMLNKFAEISYYNKISTTDIINRIITT